MSRFDKSVVSLGNFVSDDEFSDDLETELDDDFRSPLISRDEIDPQRRGIAMKSLDLEFKNLEYFVDSPLSHPSMLCKKKEDGGESQILNGISGYCPSSSFLAILGSSGAGKTSLLNILAKRLEGGRTTGEIRYGGRKFSPRLRDRISYCVQEDILIPSLTVRESLDFALQFRLNQLGERWRAKQRKERVDELISELLLTKVADSMVGSVEKKGLSGGERRRLSIGLELVLLPSLLFLDEPTTGLDSFSALSVMKTIKSFSEKKGLTTVCTIHQPRSNIFQLFDWLLLLSNGKVVYFGKANEMVSYFDKLGYECPLYLNPADFVFDTLHGERGRVAQNEIEFGQEPEKELEQEDGFENDLVLSLLGSDDENDKNGDEEGDDLSLTERFSNHFEQSEQHNSMTKYLTASAKKNSIHDTPTSSSSSRSPAVYEPSARSSVRAQWILLKRSWITYSRNPSVVNSRFFAAFFAGLLIGLIFFQQSDDVDNIVAASCFLICAFGLFCLPTVSMYVENRMMFRRDCQRGYYSAFSFSAANQAVETPILLLQVLLYSLISYWMVGFTASVQQFITFLVIVFLETEVCFGVCQICSIVCDSVNSAIAAYVSFFLFCLALGGFIIPPSSIPTFMKWLMYFTPFWYGFAAVLNNEYKNDPNGHAVLVRYELDEMNQWFSIGILFEYWVIVQFLQCLMLHYSVTRGKSKI